MSKDKENDTTPEETNADSSTKDQSQSQENQEQKAQDIQDQLSNSGNLSSEEIEKLKQDLKALQGVVSGKDKQLNETKKKAQGLEDQFQSLQDQLKVKDMLLESDYPEPVKIKLKKNIENLNSDNFESVANDYMEIFNQGLEFKKQETQKKIENRPEPDKPEGWDEKLNKATSIDDLKDLM